MLQRKRVTDELIDVERSSCLIIIPEVRAYAVDHRSCAMAICDDVLESFLGSIEVWRRAIEKPKTRIGARNHCGQRLFDFVRNRGSDGVPGHPPRLALA